MEDGWIVKVSALRDRGVESRRTRYVGEWNCCLIWADVRLKAEMTKVSVQVDFLGVAGPTF